MSRLHMYIQYAHWQQDEGISFLYKQTIFENMVRAIVGTHIDWFEKSVFQIFKQYFVDRVKQDTLFQPMVSISKM